MQFLFVTVVLNFVNFPTPSVQIPKYQFHQNALMKHEDGQDILILHSLYVLCTRN